MSAIQAPALARSSKRKRALVNYYDGDSDVGEGVAAGEGDSEDVVEYSAPKKRRATRPLPKSKIFPFLQLPAEIRNMIYELCLSSPWGVYLIPDTVKYRRTVAFASENYIRNLTVQTGLDYEERDAMARPRSFVPSLLAVNKQIYKEASDMLYGNEFFLDDTLTLHSFIVNIGPRAAAKLTNLTLRGWCGYRGMHKAYNHAAFAVLALSATNLQRFHFDCWLFSSAGPQWIARQIYRDGFPWLEAVGAAKGSITAAVDVIEMREDNFTGRGWRRRTSQPVNPERDLASFRAELTKLLVDHQKRLYSRKKKKQSKKGSKQK